MADTHLGYDLPFRPRIERTSFAERFEKKGYLILEFETDGLKAGAQA
jgi:hypothetical protein